MRRLLILGAVLSASMATTAHARCDVMDHENYVRCQLKEAKEEEKTQVRTYQFGGTLVQNLKAKGLFYEFRYWPKGGGPSHEFSREVFAREIKRCDAQAKLFFVNDAL